MTDNLTMMKSNTEIAQQLKMWSHAYYNQEALVSDQEYDDLYDYLKKIEPTHSIFKEIGSPVIGNKTKHIYYTGSLSKVKPSSPELKRFINKGIDQKIPNMLLSEKLDGVSIVFRLITHKINGKSKYKWVAMSRGDGVYGQDVSNNLLHSEFNLPDPNTTQMKILIKSIHSHHIIIRGELIIPKSFPSSKPLRSIVNGVVNTKTPNKELLPHVDFLAYGLPGSGLKPIQQFAVLDSMGFKTPNHTPYDVTDVSITEIVLKKILKKWRSNSPYDIDGIVMSWNIYEEPSDFSKCRNPEYSKAFKMLLHEQTKSTYIKSIHWKASSSGLLHPTATLDPPVIIGSANITRVTCINADFVCKNNIGPGAEVLISRSGDVIPKIEKIIQPASQSSLPTDIEFHWDDNHKNIFSNDTSSDSIRLATFVRFATKLGINGLKEGTIKRFISCNIHSPEQLAEISLIKLQEMTGLNKQVSTIFKGYHDKMSKIRLEQFIDARTIMGRGFGEKVVKSILDDLGYERFIASDLEGTKSEKSTRDIPTAITRYNKYLELYCNDNFPVFQGYLNSMIQRYQDSSLEIDTVDSVDVTLKPLGDQAFVFTGGKDHALIQAIQHLGGTVLDRVSSKHKTLTLLTNSLESSSSKMTAAKSKNIPIKLITQFKKEIQQIDA